MSDKTPAKKCSAGVEGCGILFDDHGHLPAPAEKIRERAERLAGPHDRHKFPYSSCGTFYGDPCSCGQAQRAEEIAGLIFRLAFLEEIGDGDWCGEHERRFAANAREGDEGLFDECQICRAEKAEAKLAEARREALEEAARLVDAFVVKVAELTVGKMGVVRSTNVRHAARDLLRAIRTLVAKEPA